MTQSQLELLTHVARYRVTTVDALRAVFYEERSAAQKAASRLVTSGALWSYPIGGRSFYQLTRRGAAAVGAPKNIADRLGSQGLRGNYGVLAFCCLGEPLRQRLMPQEFRSAFPKLAGQPGIDPSAQYYYIDEHRDRRRLGRAVVDVDAQPPRVIRKCRSIVRALSEMPAFAPLLEDEFVLTILTASESKKTALRTLLTTTPLGPLVRVVVVEALSHIPGGQA